MPLEIVLVAWAVWSDIGLLKNDSISFRSRTVYPRTHVRSYRTLLFPSRLSVCLSTSACSFSGSEVIWGAHEIYKKDISDIITEKI